MSYCPKCGTENLSSTVFCSKCGTRVAEATEAIQVAPSKVVVIANKKSAGVAFILAFLFGPLGLFYATVSGGFIMLFAGLLSLLFLPLGIICWIICMIWAVAAVSGENSSIDKKANSF